jgi:hypothetical protein
MQIKQKQPRQKRIGRRIAEAIDACASDAQAIFTSAKRLQKVLTNVVLWLILVTSTVAYWLQHLQGLAQS